MDSDTSQRQAIDMLDAFGSVGATHFDVTWRTLGTDARDFRRGVTLDILRRTIGTVLDQVTRQQRNIIVRPLGPPVFLQLDDLDTAALEKVKPVAFLTLNTSPGNHQAWLAITGTVAEDFGSRVRKVSGADLYASGATRLAGSLNFKEKYAPNFPRVTIGTIQPGRTVTAGELEAIDLVAAPAPMPAPSPRASYRPRSAGRQRKWPDYQKCLDAAPANGAGDGPKRALADYAWCMIAADWGFSLQDTIAKLIEQSTKAQENGKGYAIKTATKAAAAAARRVENKPAATHRR